jgi:hypothetical protein
MVRSFDRRGGRSLLVLVDLTGIVSFALALVMVRVEVRLGNVSTIRVHGAAAPSRAYMAKGRDQGTIRIVVLGDLLGRF